MSMLTPTLILQLGAAGVVIFIIYKIVGWLLQEGPPNPFMFDSRKPPKPLVTDQKLRDAVLKESFNKKKIPANLDAILIGSGIGSLTTAAVLAKVGKKCLVLEQHDQAGGCCHTFIEKGYEFDVGIHYIGEMNRHSQIKVLCDQITDGQLQWEPLDDEYDTISFGFEHDSPRFPIVHPISEWGKLMKSQFPEEEKAIDKFISMSKAIRGQSFYVGLLKILPVWLSKLVVALGVHTWVTDYWSYAGKTVEEVILSLTDNPKLKAVFCYNFGDYGCPPSRGPASMQMELHNHFMKCGASYPVGGASEIAFTTIPVIEAAGGKVLVRVRVTQILTDPAGRAVGVRVKKGSEELDIHAPLVISDAGVHSTFGRLLPQHVAQKSSFYKFLKTIEPSMSCISAFIGLKCSNSELNVKKQNIWAFCEADLDKTWNDFVEGSSDDIMDKDIPFMFMSFPSVKDPTWESRYPGRSTIAVVTFAPYSWFKKWENKQVLHRGDDYDELKNTIGQKIKDRVVSLYPELEDKIDYLNIGTPVSNRYYIAWEKGEIYGLSHDVNRMSPSNMAQLRPETDVPGLFLTGQDVMTAGFCGALNGGLLAAGSVLGRNVFKDLEEITNLTKNVEIK